MPLHSNAEIMKNSMNISPLQQKREFVGGDWEGGKSSNQRQTALIRATAIQLICDVNVQC